MVWEGESLWVAANCQGPARPSDAQQGEGAILEIDPASGHTLRRWPVPGGGGVHGMEYDPYEEGMVWITTLKLQTLSKVRVRDWTVMRVIHLPYGRAHDVVRVEEGLSLIHI